VGLARDGVTGTDVRAIDRIESRSTAITVTSSLASPTPTLPRARGISSTTVIVPTITGFWIE
jgi:hypothetical protein